MSRTPGPLLRPPVPSELPARPTAASSAFTSGAQFPRSEEGVPGLDSPCMDCSRYYWPSPRTCQAFPEGIPATIWAGDERHLRPFEGDRGLRFDPLIPAS